MEKLLTVDQFILYLDELQKNQTLREKFKSRYLCYGVKDISLLPISNDFHVMWKLSLQYIEFLKTPLTYSMFEGEHQIFTGIIKTNDVYWSVNGLILFVENPSKEIVWLGFPIESIAKLNVSLCTPLYSDTGVLINVSHFNEQKNIIN